MIKLQAAGFKLPDLFCILWLTACSLRLDNAILLAILAILKKNRGFPYGDPYGLP